MEVYKLTQEQKNIITGETYDGFQFFNPTLDADGNWFISVEEFNFLTPQRAQELNVTEWFYSLPLINYNPIVIERI